MDSVTCNPKNGQLYLPIVIHDGDHSYNANYGKIIADNKDPKVDIIQPSSGLYLNNVKFFSVGNFPYAITVGPVRVSANIYDETGIESIDWYVNQHHIDFNGENRFGLWLDKNISGLKTGLNRVKVIVQDNAGNVNHDIIRINRIGR